MRLAQELHCHLCAQNKSCLLVCRMSHPWLFSHAHSSMSTSSSSPAVLPHTENIQYIPHISKLPRLTSGAIKNHSDVKTCRVAETRAQQLPQVLSRKNFRPSRESKLILEIHINSLMHKKSCRRRSASSNHNLEKLGHTACPIVNYQRTSYFPSQMHFDDSVESITDSDLGGGDLQKMITSPLCAQKASGKPVAMVIQEREISAQNTQADRKESLRSRSSEGQKALETRCIIFIWIRKPDQEFCVQIR